MIYLFDRLSHITLEDWNNSKACSLFRRVKFYPTEWICESDMTEEEKKSNTSYETCGGYLKENDTTTAFTDWWCELSESEKNVIRSIENFDITKFFKITGINA
jgi:hypothetical protein